MKGFLIGGIAIAALSTAAAVSAQSTPSPSIQSHARASFFTSNQNRSDVPTHIDRLFKGLDLNHDGFVTRDEIKILQTQFDDRVARGSAKRSERMFGRLDANHDGRITQSDIDSVRAARAASNGEAPKPGRGSSLLLRADANKDGAVTRAEYDAAITSGKIKLRHANMRGSSIVRMFEAADTNKDGRLSLEEADQASLRQFDTADVNRDGVLTPEERRQANKARRKAHLAS